MNYDKLPYLMTRQEVAGLIGMSWQFVRNNEQELGLKQCRVMWTSNRVRYKRDFVVSLFKKNGMISS